MEKIKFYKTAWFNKVTSYLLTLGFVTLVALMVHKVSFWNGKVQMCHELDSEIVQIEHPGYKPTLECIKKSELMLDYNIKHSQFAEFDIDLNITNITGK
jgi:hypothetical protein